MKRFTISLIGAAVFLLASNSAFADSRYQCYRYVNGSPTGTWVHVRADSKAEATTRAIQRFRELGGRVDSANCHLD